ncbi:MAG: tetratricopeptide repeat protein [Alphaproteobacteria bacterium]|jgi:tetratricopeptide (TPR) repeat protein|nr:tetratricopeptide repeat protein [Alphaproteobacteria bacterium]
MKKKINKKIFYLCLSLLLVIFLGFLLFNNTLNKPQDPESAINYVIQARMANSNFDYKKADSFYRKAHRADPNNTNLTEEYLLFSIMQRDLKQSFALAQEVIVKNPQHFLANLVILVKNINSSGVDSAINNLSNANIEKDSLLDIVLTTLKSYQAMQKNDMVGFESLNADIKDLAPDFYLYQKGLLDLYNKRTEQAQKDFFNLNNLFVNIESIIYYSQLLYMDGKKEEAVQYFYNYLGDNFLTQQKIVDYVSAPIIVNEKSVISDLIFRLSKMLSPDVDMVYLYSDSIAVANIALMLDPKNISALVEVASFYKAIGNYDKALSIYTSLPENSYYSRILTGEVVDMYKEQGNVKEAIAYIQKQIKIDPNNARLFVELGLIQHKGKNYQDAIDSYTKALQISTDNNFRIGKWLAHFFRGISYDKLGNWEMAEKDILAAKEINSTDPVLINYLAYSWINRGMHIEESLGMLKGILAKMPNNPNILDSYAWGLFKSGNYTEALKYAEKANAILAYDPILVNHLGDILWQLGYKRDAIATWARAANLSPEDDLAAELSKKLDGDFPPYLNKNVAEKDGYVPFAQKQIAKK